MYFDAGDAQGCAEQLVRLAASTQLRSELGRRLQGRQRRLFSVSTQVDALEQVYRR
jgi:hypothetical protein